MSHLLKREHWTFEVVATKHRWDMQQKSDCCRNAAVCYLLVSLILFAGVAVDMFVIDLRYIGRTRKRLRRTWEQAQRDVTVASFNEEQSDDEAEEDEDRHADSVYRNRSTNTNNNNNDNRSLRYNNLSSSSAAAASAFDMADDTRRSASYPRLSLKQYAELIRPRRATRWVLHQLGLRRQGVEEDIVEEKEAGNQHVASLVATQSSFQPVVRAEVYSNRVEGAGSGSWLARSPRRQSTRQEEDTMKEEEQEGRSASDVVHARWTPRRGGSA